jgi:hypothetical protein
VCCGITAKIDKALGGRALVRKKTVLAVVAYAILSILQAVGVVGTFSGPLSTTSGQILTIAILLLGAIGLLAKIDRFMRSVQVVRPSPEEPGPFIITGGAVAPGAATTGFRGEFRLAYW